MRFTSYCLAVAVSVLAVGCREAAPLPDQLTLEQVRVYGEAEADPSALAGGGMLAGVSGIAELPDSRLVVLDGVFRKLIVFSTDGAVELVIPLREGDGPGEIRLARDLTIRADGAAGVLDYERVQVSWFDLASGNYESSTPVLRQTLRVHATEGGIWITQSVFPGSMRPAASLLAFDGTLVREVPRLDEELPYFGTVVFTLDGEGQPLVPHPVPGLWTHWDRPEGLLRGVGLVEVRPSPPGERPPGTSPTGIALSPDGLVLETWLHELPSPEGADSPPLRERHMTAFASNGDLLGEVTGEIGNELFVSPTTGHIFMVYDEPFPQVREFRLRDD